MCFERADGFRFDEEHKSPGDNASSKAVLGSWLGARNLTNFAHMTHGEFRRKITLRRVILAGIRGFDGEKEPVDDAEVRPCRKVRKVVYFRIHRGSGEALYHLPCFSHDHGVTRSQRLPAKWSPSNVALRCASAACARQRKQRAGSGVIQIPTRCVLKLARLRDRPLLIALLLVLREDGSGKLLSVGGCRLLGPRQHFAGQRRSR